MSFSCFLIGGDTLLAQCGELLIERGHAISGVISSEKRIQEWAESKGLAVISADGNYTDVLVRTEFDYLFAITHLALIPDEAIRSPRRMAVNFHDGPLPAYAGLNAPMWALLNGETDYAITWHTIAPGIDTGDVLLQVPFSIASDDTALSLNTKCFAAALDSFPSIIDSLAGGSEQLTCQDLSNRSYYSRTRRPPNACVLDWRQSAVDLERTIRALNTGRYANPVGSAKLLLDDVAVIVTSAQVAPLGAYAEPGQIVAIDADSIRIATAESGLDILSITEFDGSSRTLEDLVSSCGLTTGSSLPLLGEEEAAHLTKLVQDSARWEASWIDELGNVEAIDLPYRRAEEEGSNERQRRVLEVPDAFHQLTLERGMTNAVAGAFLQFLARVLGASNFHAAVCRSESSSQIVDISEILFERHGFVGAEIDTEALTWQQAASLQTKCEAIIERGPWLKDLVGRNPRLAGNRCLSAEAQIPVLIAFCDTASDYKLGGNRAAAELTLCVAADGTAMLEYSLGAYSSHTIDLLCRHFTALLEAMGLNENLTFRELELVSNDERRKLVSEWNATDVDYDRSLTIQGAFHRKAEEMSDRVALICRDESISYSELDRRSNEFALRLAEKRVGANVLVGVHVPRSIDLLVATLGVLKAGGAYVPLDPSFPGERLNYMVDDSEMKVVVSHSSLSDQIDSTDIEVLLIDGDSPSVSDARIGSSNESTAADLAYVIYTSGSTGRPKGVMIEHRNAINYFEAMDRAIPYEEESPGTWLAVTSLSFDISVLELLWTLTRGFRVVIHDETLTKVQVDSSDIPMKQRIGLGLFMWGNDDAPGPAKYRLLIEGAKYFDENGFDAVWTPERHFHAFGGPYPNPAVTGAAVAAITEHVIIRAGSCVVPLHHPVRIAEEWSVVDNLSDGRVEIAAASGWNPNDFVLKPENHKNNKDVMMTQLEEVRRLWRGETVAFPGPLGKDVEVQSLPRPVQSELPCWITTAGNPETWRLAGEGGFHVLTHLLGQTTEEVGEKIRIYREARAKAGFDPDSGQVALMLHTFVGSDDDEVREIVREPMKSYLASSMRLAINFAWSFPAFKRPGNQDTKPEDVDIASLSEEEVDTILNFAFERYFSNSGLFGSVDTCLKMLRRCSQIGVSEIACLLDFGVNTDVIMESLPRLLKLKQRADADVSLDTVGAVTADYSFSAMVDRHQPTHMQCTPSMARMYLSGSDSAQAFKKIPHLLLGGEALPVELVKAVNAGREGTLTNMYGPTETTIWSTTHRLADADITVPIGRPIANTRCYILDELGHPVPVGVPGELYIGGDGVARGYFKRPDLTSERFVRDPFVDSQDARMYATGDLAKYREDGTIEYLGRTDFQVKIRGYRIELGEIEASLESSNDVAEAAVSVRTEDESDHRLVGFVVGANGVSPDTAALRSGLGKSLPEYMVPSEITVLAEMPRTANGKLDRKALTELRTSVARAVNKAEVPQDDTQQKIAEAWQQVLKLNEVGIDENFFDLGGHSLLVVQLHNRLGDTFSSALSLTDLYQYPTIRTLSAFLRSGQSNEALQKGSSRGARRRALRSRSA